MGNTVNKPLDDDNITDGTTNDNIDKKLDVKNIIYDTKIKNYDDALISSIKNFKNTNTNHILGYLEKRSFIITSFEKYGDLYYYYTNNIFFDCDYITNLRASAEGNEKIKMFIVIYEQIYDINDIEKILTLNKYGKNIKFLFCTETPIVNPFYVFYDAYVASKNYRNQILSGRIVFNNIEYDNGVIIHISSNTNAKVNSICKKFFKNDNIIM